MTLIDTHCHLNFPEYADDLNAVLERAQGAGVGRMIVIATRLAQAAELKALAQAHEELYCTVGSHPHEADNDADIQAQTLIDLAQHPKVCAIGESGLDFFKDKAGRAAQCANFQAHITAARETNLPLVIHSRECDKEMQEIISKEHKEKGSFKAVLHCYTGGPELAQTALDLGFYISISGIITFKNAQPLRDLAKTLPKDRILIETDAPFLAPEPHRGQRNEPAYITNTAKKLAEVLDMTEDDLTQQTTENAKTLFAPHLS